MLIILTLLSVWLTTSFFPDANDTASIKGRIVDSNGPVVQANVALKGTTRGVTTNDMGSFAINELRPGTYTLVVSVIGYKRLEREVRLVVGQSVELELRLEKMTFDLDQVVVTGTMTETSVADSPVKVEVVSPKMFRMNPTSNITEALQTVNGIYNQLDCAVCGTNNLRINGMEGPYTAILIDGNPIMGSLASVYGFNGINPALIDQVEIVRGPSSTLYGSEAMGGVINIRTTNPRFAPKYVVDLNANDLSEMNVDFALAPAVGRGRTLISGSIYHFDRFVDRNSDGFSDLTRNTRVSLFNKWSYGSLDPKGFDAYVKYYGENRMGGTAAFNRSMRGSDEVYGESIYTQRLEAAAMAILRNAASVTRVQVSGSFHDQDSYYGDYGYKATQTNMFANLTNDRRVGPSLSLLAGASLRYENLEQTFSENLDFNGADRRFIPGIFAQSEYGSGKTFGVLGGLRVDNYNTHGLIYSPRLSLRAQPATGTTFRINTGTGFRVVNLFTEEHEVITGVREIVIEGQIKPERSRNISFNINQLLNNGHSATTIDLDVYLTRFTNQIFPEYVSESGQNFIVYRNADSKSTSRGISMSVTQNFDFPLTFSVGGTLQDVFVTESDGTKRDLEFSSDFLGVFTSSYTFSSRIRPSLDWTGRVVGPMKLPEYEAPFERDSYSPWFTEQNVQLTVRPNNQVELYLSIKNFLNYTQKNAIIDPGNPFGDSFDTSYVYGPLLGRRFMVGVRVRAL